jgi:hypothetical protein
LTVVVFPGGTLSKFLSSRVFPAGLKRREIAMTRTTRLLLGLAAAAALCGAAHAQSVKQTYDPGIPRSMQNRTEGGDPERGMVSNSTSDSRQDPIEDRGMKGTPNTGRSEPNPGMVSGGSSRASAQSLDYSRPGPSRWRWQQRFAPAVPFGYVRYPFAPGAGPFPSPWGRRF